MSFNPSDHNSTSNPMVASNEEIERRDDAEEGGDQMDEDIDLDTGQENENEERNQNKNDGAYKKGRMKKSTVWEHMIDVPEEDGTVKKVQCKHCKEFFKKVASGTTTTYKRHLNNCVQKRLAMGEKGKQQVLSFSTDTASEGITSINNFRYDHAKVRELASHMVLAHEYPFSMMDHVIFNKFMKAVSPFYQKISRYIVKKDCISTYESEKRKLKNLLKGVTRISITTDLWKSNQKIQYMVVTGHFVDATWVLQKRVLNFCNVPPPHTGVIIADALSRCFVDWGIENKISSITVDNASYNDVCVKRIKEDFLLRKQLSIGGKIFHVRCCAHILNLLVQDGLSEIGSVIDTVREGIKYINNSESRRIEFCKIKKQLRLSSKSLYLDCPTRWNGTYMMLASALEFKDVFSRYSDIDVGFRWVPPDSEWMQVEEVCQFLGVFHEITNMISGSHYPTANIFLPELYRIKELLNEKEFDQSSHMREMAKKMKAKFDKYWGESNILLSLGAILDPRYKMELIDFAFPIIYGEEAAPMHIDMINQVLHDLYAEYVSSLTSSSTEERPVLKRKQQEGSSSGSLGSTVLGRNILTGKAKFQLHVSKSDRAPPEKSDLDVYLSESRYACDANANLDVLSWWKGERWRFRILSRMASDLLSIPVTTVASESTFSAGGRIIDDRRASMSVDTVEMLLCASDWIKNLHGIRKDSTKEVSQEDDIFGYKEIVLPD